MKCKICEYEWKPRKKKPRQCPKCKRYDYLSNLGRTFKKPKILNNIKRGVK